MFTAILTKQTASRGGIALPQMRYVTERVGSNIDRLVDYYQNSGGFADSRHILIRALSNLTGSYTVPPGYYADYVLDNYDNSCRAEGITTATSMGAIHRNGHFYGRGSDEIYIAIESYGNANVITRNWRTQEPVKVLRHPYMDMNLNLPDGKGFIDGVAVFTIDFVVLGLMYRAWRLEEDRKPAGTGETLAQFIYQYVLPGMLRSQANVAMLNRVAAEVNGLDTGLVVKKKIPLSLPDNTSYVNTIATQYVQWALNSGRSFEQLIQSFPQPFSESVTDTVVASGIPRTRQSRWATTVAEVPLLAFLLDIDQETQSQANVGEKVDIKRDLRIMKTERTFQGVRGGVLSELQDELSSLIEAKVN